jgi:four helix bundle protein
MESEKNKYDLEDRLIAFACLCLEVCDLLPNSKAGQILEYQLTKSSTSSALNYGEVQGAESRADFLHKMKTFLKELKECRINLKIIKHKPIIAHPKVDAALVESGELVAIFLTSVDTAKKNGLSVRK